MNNSTKNITVNSKHYHDCIVVTIKKSATDKQANTVKYKVKTLYPHKLVFIRKTA